MLCKEVLIVPFLVPFGINGCNVNTLIGSSQGTEEEQESLISSKSENVSPISSPNEKEKPVWYSEFKSKRHDID